jgi:hypothetical protein
MPGLDDACGTRPAQEIRRIPQELHRVFPKPPIQGVREIQRDAPSDANPVPGRFERSLQTYPPVTLTIKSLLTG